jgi:two-component system, chemotaxis family, CheB/CheR fusion protein
MARTHELLSRNNWEGADLARLIEATVSAYASPDGGNLVLDGLPIRLNATAAATCGLIFFELASNAAKYGALAAKKGRVQVAWHNAEPQGFLSVVWKEFGGPAVTEPLKKNFGTTFIQQSLAYELGGSADLQFNKSGLKCTLKIPLSKTETSAH